jgi:hypothetical protein
MLKRKSPESYEPSERTLLKFISRSVAVQVIGFPVVIGGIATVYTKGAELFVDVFVDKPDYPSRMIGLCTGLGLSALGACFTAVGIRELRKNLIAEADQPLASVISLEEYRRLNDLEDDLEDVDPDFELVKDRVWEGIVSRLVEQPES